MRLKITHCHLYFLAKLSKKKVILIKPKVPISSVLDFHLDTIGIKQELSEGNTEKPSVYKSSHKCSICKATFPQRYLLKNHVNQVHFDINEGNEEKIVGNNEHMCSICNQ